MRRVALVDVAEAVDLGGDIVADEQGVARVGCVERVLLLAQHGVLVSLVLSIPDGVRKEMISPGLCSANL